MSDTVTRPTTPAEWARALDAMTADQVARHVSSPPWVQRSTGVGAACGLVSRAHSAGVVAGVSLASDEIHALHGLPDTALLSADGRWAVIWCAREGYWDWEYYERPRVRVALCLAHDMRGAGLPDHPAIVRQQHLTWRTAARRIAEELLTQLTIIFVADEVSRADRVDAARTFAGDLTLAGRIWQRAHDASDPGVSAAWLVADLAHDEDFNSWELTVRRYRARGRPEHIETVVTGTPEPDSEYLEAYLRGSGYGTIGPWVEVGGYGDTGILVTHP